MFTATPYRFLAKLESTPIA